jgi:hypothetical protein
MLSHWFSKKPAPLTGAPPVRRLKTYTSQSGYVYEYFYEGRRPFQTGNDSGAEFVFSVSASRKAWQPVSVLVSDSAIQSWETAHARVLSPTERYAIAKMSLFQAFDERSTPALMKSPVGVRAADIAAILETLDLE